MRVKTLRAAVCLTVIALAAAFPSHRAHAQTLGSRATLTAQAGAIIGTVRDGADKPIPAARLRLRDLGSGRILMTTRGDQEGQFRFGGVPAGSYLVELVDESGSVLAVGQSFTMAPGEATSTFIRLGARPPWYSGFFSNAAMVAVSSAAGLGVTAVGSGFQPASGRF